MLNTELYTTGNSLVFFVWLFILILVFVYRDRVCLCGLGWPGTPSVDQASLCLLNAGLKGVYHHAWLQNSCIFKIN